MRSYDIIREPRHRRTKQGLIRPCKDGLNGEKADGRVGSQATQVHFLSFLLLPSATSTLLRRFIADCGFGACAFGHGAAAFLGFGAGLFHTFNIFLCHELSGLPGATQQCQVLSVPLDVLIIAQQAVFSDAWREEG